jgi:hypothetical protein
MKNEYLFRFIKICDIGYITSIYFLFAIFISKICDNIFGEFNKMKEKHKGKFRQLIELMGIFWIYIVIIYASKNIVELIPSPFDGINGFQHSLVKEIKTGFAFFFIFLYLQKHFLDKLVYFYKHV